MKVKVIEVTMSHTLELLHQFQPMPKEYTEEFLQFPHRHLFTFTIKLTVNHLNRDLEFFQFKHQIFKPTLHDLIEELTIPVLSSGKQVSQSIPNIGSYSCEMLADKVLGLLSGWGVTEVTVSEDGENSATVKYVEL